MIRVLGAGMAVLLLVAAVEGAGKTAPDPELRRLAKPLVIDVKSGLTVEIKLPAK